MSRRGATSRSAASEPEGAGHEIRAGRDAAEVVGRAGSGDVVVLNRLDLDPERARELIARGVYGVVNGEPSLSGRFPSAGPLLLVRAGIILIDDAGAGVSELRDGERVRIVAGRVLRGITWSSRARVEPTTISWPNSNTYALAVVHWCGPRPWSQMQ